MLQERLHRALKHASRLCSQDRHLRRTALLIEAELDENSSLRTRSLGAIRVEVFLSRVLEVARRQAAGRIGRDGPRDRRHEEHSHDPERTAPVAQTRAAGFAFRLCHAAAAASRAPGRRSTARLQRTRGMCPTCARRFSPEKGFPFGNAVQTRSI